MSVCLHLGVHELLYLYLTLFTRNMISAKKVEMFHRLSKVEFFRPKVAITKYYQYRLGTICIKSMYAL